MWRKTKWIDPQIQPEDFLGGSQVRLTYPDGNVVIGKLTVVPNSAYKQNDKVTMARIMTRFAGDIWMNVRDADVEIWESDAFEES